VTYNHDKPYPKPVERTSWGWKQEIEDGRWRGNHYGFKLDSIFPVTGVLSNNDIPYLAEAMFEDGGIDLSFEDHVKECHDGDSLLCDDGCWESDGSGTYLIGDWKQDHNDNWYPDIHGKHGYTAITGESYTQVAWSKHTTHAALCSPCYPGQCDVPSEGIWLAYTMPPEYMDDNPQPTDDAPPSGDNGEIAGYK